MDLVRFGFTATEAQVYLALLPISPATGYAVAQSAKLARANTYDALEGLAGARSRHPTARQARPVRRLGPGRARGSAAARVLERPRLPGRGAESDTTGAVQRRARRRWNPIADRASLFERAIDCARSARSELLAVVGPWAGGDLRGSRGGSWPSERARALARCAGARRRRGTGSPDAGDRGLLGRPADRARRRPATRRLRRRPRRG